MDPMGYHHIIIIVYTIHGSYGISSYIYIIVVPCRGGIFRNRLSGLCGGLLSTRLAEDGPPLRAAPEEVSQAAAAEMVG